LKFLIIYDIPVEFDSFRTKISNILLSYNMVRLNYSVFFGELTFTKAEEIGLKLGKLLKDVPGDVRIFPICKKCHERVITVKSKFEKGFNLIKEILAL